MKFLFAWRYFKATKTTNAINIISWISILAITIGTASLILVLSVFNGFDGLVKSLYSSFYPAIKIIPTTGKTMVLTPAQLAAIRKTTGVSGVSLTVEDKALLQNNASFDDSTDYQSVIYLKGVDSNFGKVTDVPLHMLEGNFKTGTVDEPLLVLGAGIQNAVSVETDRNVRPLVIYMARKGTVNLSDPFQSLSSELVNVAGSFVIQQDFDNKYALTNLDFVKRMLQLGPDDYGAAELSLGTHEVNKVKSALKGILGAQYQVQDRYEQNAQLYSVMRIEKWIIYAILVLILGVAAFNMVGALTMLVLEKQQDISVLNSMGARASFIQGIFLSEGLLIALIGGGLGMLIAYGAALLQLKFHLIKLKGNTFMINYFPVELHLSDFILVTGTVLVISVLASWLPARKASRQEYMIREL